MATVTLLLRRVEPPPLPSPLPSPSAAIFSDATTLFPLFSPSQLLFFKTPKAKNQIHHTFNSKPLHVPLSNSFKNGSNNSSADTSCPVPFDQQPINEYQTLSTSFPFSWAAGDFVEYCSRLFVTGASFALLIGLPVAWLGAPGADAEPLKRILAAASSGVFVVTLAVVRMYLGWAYVGNRLLSATVEYEETGWYDGQVWVKTAEVLARDRLLGSFSVKPVLTKLKYTLVTLGATLFICGVLLINDIDQGNNNKDASYYSDPKRAIPGVYKDDSARYFEPDAFYTESAQSDASC